MAVTKKEFVKRMTEKGNIRQARAEELVDLFLETLVDCLKKDGTMKLYGFGRFEVKTAREQIGRNPKNGREYLIPEHKKVKFYASETLTDKVESR